MQLRSIVQKRSYHENDRRRQKDRQHYCGTIKIVETKTEADENGTLLTPLCPEGLYEPKRKMAGGDNAECWRHAFAISLCDGWQF